MPKLSLLGTPALTPPGEAMSDPRRVWTIRFRATEPNGLSGTVEVQARTIVEAINATQKEFPTVEIYSAISQSVKP